MKLAALYRYPVKSMQGEGLPRAALTARGIPGDRLWALRGPDAKPIVRDNLSAKQEARLLTAFARYTDEGVLIQLPDGTRLAAGEAAAAEISKWLDMPLSFHEEPAAHFDSGFLHLNTTGDLRRAGVSDPRRFRPNLVIETDEDARDWIGSRLRVGRAVLKVVKLTRRCSMVSAAQPGLPHEPSILKTVAKDGFGVYAEVETPAEVAVGDAVERLP